MLSEPPDDLSNTMSAILYKHVCASCGAEFHASGVPEMSYGEFIMRTESSEEAYLEATSDPVFAEVLKYVRSHPWLAGTSRNESGNVAQAIFGVACDPSPHGQLYHVEMMPACTRCRCRSMRSWAEVMPLQCSHIPAVTHAGWATLAETEKIAAIDSAINTFFCK